MIAISKNGITQNKITREMNPVDKSHFEYLIHLLKNKKIIHEIGVPGTNVLELELLPAGKRLFAEF